MIIVKDKGKNSKIYIPRASGDIVKTNTNVDVDLTDYYTKDEVEEYVNEQIGNIYIPDVDLTDYYTKEEVISIIDDKFMEKGEPIYIISYLPEEDLYDFESGNFGSLYNSIINRMPYTLYVPYGDTTEAFTTPYFTNVADEETIIVGIILPSPNGTILRNLVIKPLEITVVDTEYKYATTDYVDIKIDSIDIPSLDGYATTSELNNKQDKLVSGENIKTINGNSILGSGDITIVGGSSSNIVELTQAEYDALTEKDSETLYLISDANVESNYKTINGESILGDGNIDLSNYATQTYVQEQIGDINNILENIIG